MKGNQIALAVVLVVLVAVSSGLAGYTIGRAQGEPAYGKAHLGGHPSERSPEFARGERRGESVEKFKELQQKDPERFKKLMEQRAGQVKERLTKLREKDPEKYREILEKQIDRLEGNLAKLKEELAKPTEK